MTDAAELAAGAGARLGPVIKANLTAADHAYDPSRGPC